MNIIWCWCCGCCRWFCMFFFCLFCLPPFIYHTSNRKTKKKTTPLRDLGERGNKNRDHNIVYICRNSCGGYSYRAWQRTCTQFPLKFSYTHKFWIVSFSVNGRRGIVLRILSQINKCHKKSILLDVMTKCLYTYMNLKSIFTSAILFQRNKWQMCGLDAKIELKNKSKKVKTVIKAPHFMFFTLKITNYVRKMI